MTRPTPRPCALARRLGPAVLLALACATPAHAGPIEQATLDHLADLRAVQPTTDGAAIARYNAQMDAAWKFFSDNKAAATPVLREQLAAELRKPRPNDLLLLDVGLFLQMENAPEDKALAASALLAIDATAPVVRQNDRELFEFTHRVAISHDERVLPFIDKAFLRQPTAVDIPQHALRLDATLVCVYLYGVYGDGAEAHLQALLADKAVARKVIEILVWLGSPDSVPAVADAYGANHDYDTFQRMTAFMMKAGGPQGRAAMLALRPEDLDARSRAYYAQSRPAIESTGFDSWHKALGTHKPGDEQVKAALATIDANFGDYGSTPPSDILDATLPRDELIRDLVAIRARTFHRLSDEALSDVETTNALIDALRFRKQ